ALVMALSAMILVGASCARKSKDIATIPNPTNVQEKDQSLPDPKKDKEQQPSEANNNIEVALTQLHGDHVKKLIQKITENLSEANKGKEALAQKFAKDLSDINVTILKNNKHGQVQQQQVTLTGYYNQKPFKLMGQLTPNRTSQLRSDNKNDDLQAQLVCLDKNSNTCFVKQIEILNQKDHVRAVILVETTSGTVESFFPFGSFVTIKEFIDLFHSTYSTKEKRLIFPNLKYVIVEIVSIMVGKNIKSDQISFLRLIYVGKRGQTITTKTAERIRTESPFTNPKELDFFFKLKADPKYGGLEEIARKVGGKLNLAIMNDITDMTLSISQQRRLVSQFIIQSTNLVEVVLGNLMTTELRDNLSLQK
ncbi:MAG: hypothetical protein NZ480_00570, partial [Bdellovibrionaceae bacterium]|nr:hypothetical protein [Pseudobdellovibrionaceae bacterium]